MKNEFKPQELTTEQEEWIAFRSFINDLWRYMQDLAERIVNSDEFMSDCVTPMVELVNWIHDHEPDFSPSPDQVEEMKQERPRMGFR